MASAKWEWIILGEAPLQGQHSIPLGKNKMSNYIQITFTNIQQENQEMLIAHLAEVGFDGFEENENELKAFIPEKKYNRELLNEMVFKYQLSYDEQIIPEQNWNAVWESNFPPVVVEDFVAIRADFHAPIKNVQHELIITPKMSFGTGHHATTYMMVDQMRSIDFKGKKVFDFGTGTGILAILAEKLGAATITAIDNDDWSIANAKENIDQNDCSKIKLEQKDNAIMDEKYDIILANINKNVILGNLAPLSGQLIPQGTMLISGFLKEDTDDLVAVADRVSLIFKGRSTKGNWICLRFMH
ncbi:MAG TPA: 50S ribosomal protein L11 methyltransferase [Chitinophagaceae bacterium]|nr:50S ribosomal protein L11 methyltransferase [Chitinophagaceae bacterium]